MQWSEYQRAIFDFISDPANGSAVADAKAGSGKTTTLVEGMRHIPFSTSRVLFVAFNKAIADELRHRVPEDVQARTFNSLGAEVVRKNLGVSQATPSKVNTLIKKNADEDLKTDYFSQLKKVIDSAKSSGIGVIYPLETSKLAEIAAAYDIVFPRSLEKKALQTAKKILKASFNDTETVDFADQLLFPLYYDLPFPDYQLIFVDEAQDLNNIQHEFLSRLRQNDNSRIIAVGDPRQAIYAFRGANSNSLSELASRFNCTHLPLSISYRCSLNVIEEAQRYEPNIEAAEDAPPGSVDRIDRERFDITGLDGSCMILCRSNAPIIGYAMEFLKKNLPVTVRSDFGRNFIRWLDSFTSTTLEDFFIELDEWRQERVRFAEERDVPAIAQRAEETVQAIRYAAERAEVPEDIRTTFETLLYEHPEAPILSTIHKAKGLEADHVYLIRPDLVPSKWATKEWEVEQEYNLLYVAITRARITFHYVGEEF